MKNRKELGKHDYSGSCSPEDSVSGYKPETFSYGIFQWLAKFGGKGLKKSAVVYRIKGPVSLVDVIKSRADDVCDELDNGLFYTRKSETVK